MMPSYGIGCDYTEDGELICLLSYSDKGELDVADHVTIDIDDAADTITLSSPKIAGMGIVGRTGTYTVAGVTRSVWDALATIAYERARDRAR